MEGRHAGSATFPEAHPLNGTFASPILADGKVVFVGGAFEQWYAHNPKYKACTGRAYVVALEPKTGKIAWKYDVGPKPEPLDPPIKIKDAWGEHVFHCGPATSTIWSTPSYDAATKTIFFGTDTNNAPRTADEGRSAARYQVWLRPHRHRRRHRPGEVGDANQPRRRLASRNARLRSQDRPIPRPVDRRHAEGLHDRARRQAREGGRRRLQERRLLRPGRCPMGRSWHQTPVYTGKPALPLDPPPDSRMLALPGPLGGLQTGCATDGKKHLHQWSRYAPRGHTGDRKG